MGPWAHAVEALGYFIKESRQRSYDERATTSRVRRVCDISQVNIAVLQLQAGFKTVGMWIVKKQPGIYLPWVHTRLFLVHGILLAAEKKHPS